MNRRQLQSRGAPLPVPHVQFVSLDRRIRQETKLPVQIVEDPLSSVVLGAGKMLSDDGLLKKLTAN